MAPAPLDKRRQPLAGRMRRLPIRTKPHEKCHAVGPAQIRSVLKFISGPAGRLLPSCCVSVPGPSDPPAYYLLTRLPYNIFRM